MKKFILGLLVLFLIVGCSSQPEPIIEYEESTDPFTVQVFYSQTCPICQLLRSEFIPYLQKEFGQQITVEEYDIDQEGTIELYDSYLGLYNEETQTWDLEGKLEGVEEEYAAYNRYIPLVVMGDMYAFMGYTESLLEAYIQDVHLALQGRSLASGDVSIGRWYFRQ